MERRGIVAVPIALLAKAFAMLTAKTERVEPMAPQASLA
jgi:hypothetical protein